MLLLLFTLKEDEVCICKSEITTKLVRGNLE